MSMRDIAEDLAKVNENPETQEEHDQALEQLILSTLDAIEQGRSASVLEAAMNGIALLGIRDVVSKLIDGDPDHPWRIRNDHIEAMKSLVVRIDEELLQIKHRQKQSEFDAKLAKVIASGWKLRAEHPVLPGPTVDALTGLLAQTLTLAESENFTISTEQRSEVDRLITALKEASA